MSEAETIWQYWQNDRNWSDASGINRTGRLLCSLEPFRPENACLAQAFREDGAEAPFLLGYARDDEDACSLVVTGAIFVWPGGAVTVAAAPGWNGPPLSSAEVLKHLGQSEHPFADAIYIQYVVRDDVSGHAVESRSIPASCWAFRDRDGQPSVIVTRVWEGDHRQPALQALLLEVYADGRSGPGHATEQERRMDVYSARLAGGDVAALEHALRHHIEDLREFHGGPEQPVTVTHEGLTITVGRAPEQFPTTDGE